MNLSFYLRTALLLMLSTAFFASCRPAEEPVAVDESDTVAATEAIEPVVDTVPLVEPEPTPAPAPKVVNHKPVQTTNTGTRKVYVTGYNSFGRLWGYVTLKGDQGTGVIHDAEENHYSVRCTRHGDELFAVDHNSRQYVLKISEE